MAGHSNDENGMAARLVRLLPGGMTGRALAGAALEHLGAEVIALCAERPGSSKKPARVEFRHDALPKSPVGKVLKRELRTKYWEGKGRGVA